MRGSLAFATVLALIVVGGSACKGKPGKADPTGSGSSEEAAKAAAAGLKDVNGKDAPDIELPKPSGKPPVKTDKPIDADLSKSLTGLQFAGFSKSVKSDSSSFEVSHKTDSRPRILATIMIDSCKDKPCLPMKLDAWKAKSDELNRFMPAALKALPDTTFEVGETKINDTSIIYTYQLAHTYKTDEHGNPNGSVSDAYITYYNDGVNQITVIAEYHDDVTTTRAALVKYAPREDLEKVSKAFIDAYTQAW